MNKGAAEIVALYVGLNAAFLYTTPMERIAGQIQVAAIAGHHIFGQTGARIVDAPGHSLEAPDGLGPSSFYLLEASVTGTETALMAAACAKGAIEMRHVATEPYRTGRHGVRAGRWG